MGLPDGDIWRVIMLSTVVLGEREPNLPRKISLPLLQVGEGCQNMLEKKRTGEAFNHFLSSKTLEHLFRKSYWGFGNIDFWDF